MESNLKNSTKKDSEKTPFDASKTGRFVIEKLNELALIEFLIAQEKKKKVQKK